MGCEMTRTCARRKTMNREKEEKEKRTKGTHFRPSAERLDLESGGSSPSRRNNRPNDRWRPTSLQVPAESAKSPLRSPMHGPQTTEEIQQALEIQRRMSGGRNKVQSPNIFTAFASLNLEEGGAAAQPEGMSNPLLDPSMLVMENNDGNPLGSSATTTLSGDEFQDVSANELLRIMQAAGAKTLYRREQRHFAQSPQAAAEFGDYGDPAKTPTGFRYDNHQPATPHRSPHEGRVNTPTGVPLRPVAYAISESAESKLKA